jgi:hypothetical protein
MYSPEPVGPQKTVLGAFVLTIVIMDLVFCVLRLVIAMIGLRGYAVIPEDHSLHRTVIFEVVTAAGIGVLGILANVLILLKRRIGIPLALASILFTVLNIFVGLWQARLQMPAQMGTPETIGFFVGIVLVLGMRLVLLVLYVVAVLGARKRLAELWKTEAERDTLFSYK